MNKYISEYEKKACQEIEKWKNPPPSWWKTLGKWFSVPGKYLGYAFQNIPGINYVLEKTFIGIVSMVNDFAQWTISQETTIKEYQEAGHEVNDLKDIFQLDIEKPDKIVAWLSTRYKSYAGVEGGVTGYGGIYAIPVDILAVLALNLRAIGLYASYYGFDTNDQRERLFALYILSLASSPDDLSKQLSLAELLRIARMVAQRKAWKELDSQAFVAIVKQIAKTLGVRLTKAKLAQIVPVTGAIIGGGFNIYYTSKVCEAAYHLYRERFLMEKYGENICIQKTVPN